VTGSGYRAGQPGMLSNILRAPIGIATLSHGYGLSVPAAMAHAYRHYRRGGVKRTLLRARSGRLPESTCSSQGAHALIQLMEQVVEKRCGNRDSRPLIGYSRIRKTGTAFKSIAGGLLGPTESWRYSPAWLRIHPKPATVVGDRRAERDLHQGARLAQGWYGCRAGIARR